MILLDGKATDILYGIFPSPNENINWGKFTHRHICGLADYICLCPSYIQIILPTLDGNNIPTFMQTACKETKD